MTTIRRTLRRPAVLAKTGLSRTTAYNLEKAGDFPQHFMLTARIAVWYEDDVDSWIAARHKAQIKAAAAPDHTLRRAFAGRGKARQGALA